VLLCPRGPLAPRLNEPRRLPRAWPPRTCSAETVYQLPHQIGTAFCVQVSVSI
jgi:hypothetical protein